MIEIHIHKHYCFIRGLSIEQIKLIDEALSYYIQGAEFSTAYQNYGWDGRKRLFQKSTFSFKRGLLFRVTSLLEAENIEYKIIDEESFFIVNPEIETLLESKVYTDTDGKDVYLRHYQKDAIRKYCKMRKHNEDEYHLFRGIFSLPPRSGKTVMAGMLAKVIDEYPVMFVVHKIDLALQTKEVFEQIFQEKIGIVGDNNFDVNARIVVTTIQSLCYAFDLPNENADEARFNFKLEFQEFIPSVRLCIIDECHLSGAEIFQELPKVLEQSHHIVGLSGTPYRDDGAEMLIEQLCGPIIFEYTRVQAINDGFILPTKALFIKLPEVILGKSSFRDQKKLALYENPIALDAIKKLIENAESQKMSTVIIVREKLQGNIIQKMLKCKYLHSGVRGMERKNIYEELNRKEILTIVSTVTDVGVNIPTLDSVLIANPSKSKVAAFQRIRCGTPFDNKKKGFVTVICAQVNAPRDYMSEHWKKLLNIYKSEKFEIQEINYE